jgi:8-oxo-dGTP pyrophosphatase MutT (NUDIX family)
MTQAPIRIASTAMLIRETQGLQVLMVQRNHQIDFFSGAMVFPGGKVEAAGRRPWLVPSRSGLEQRAGGRARAAYRSAARDFRGVRSS